MASSKSWAEIVDSLNVQRLDQFPTPREAVGSNAAPQNKPILSVSKEQSASTVFVTDKEDIHSDESSAGEANFSRPFVNA